MVKLRRGETNSKRKENRRKKWRSEKVKKMILEIGESK
jgi:uncharacterized lipoprotein YddW (UPF0748 family)